MTKPLYLPEDLVKGKAPCFACKKSHAGYVCNGCNVACYCNEDCQRAGWNYCHESYCAIFASRAPTTILTLQIHQNIGDIIDKTHPDFAFGLKRLTAAFPALFGHSKIYETDKWTILMDLEIILKSVRPITKENKDKWRKDKIERIQSNKDIEDAYNLQLWKLLDDDEKKAFILASKKHSRDDDEASSQSITAPARAKKRPKIDDDTLPEHRIAELNNLTMYPLMREKPIIIYEPTASPPVVQMKNNVTYNKHGVSITGAAHMVPKESQINPDGEDTFLMSDNFELFGVLDGVGGAGPDSRVYADKLRDGCMKSYLDNKSINPEGATLQEILREGYNYAKENSIGRGSTTIVLASIKNNTCHILNMGDCALFLIRGETIQCKSIEKVVDWNIPYQFGNNDLTPNDASYSHFDLNNGDILVVTSDGVSDNLGRKGIFSFVDRNRAEPAHVLAEVIVNAAVKVSKDPNAVTQFTKGARAAGLNPANGGKKDDITCMVIKYVHRA